MHPWHEVGDGGLRPPLPVPRPDDRRDRRARARPRRRHAGRRRSQARELIDDLRQLTRLPWVVVNTHVHFDHAFGNAAFRPCEIWSHAGCAEALRLHGPAQRENVVRWVPDLADGAERHRRSTRPTGRSRSAPSSTSAVGWWSCATSAAATPITTSIVRVPDTGVVFAGDLVEQGAPPGFEDSFPLDWPATLGHAARPRRRGRDPRPRRAGRARLRRRPAVRDRVPRRDGPPDRGRSCATPATTRTAMRRTRSWRRRPRTSAGRPSRSTRRSAAASPRRPAGSRVVAPRARPEPRAAGRPPRPSCSAPGRAGRPRRSGARPRSSMSVVA